MTVPGGCRAATVAFVLVLTLYPFRPPDQLPNTPMSEDGFYMLTVARHLAAGHGISYDGIEPTDGVQPAVLALYAPAFLVGDPLVLPQRIVVIIQLLLFVLSAWTCGRIASALAPAGSASAVATLWWIGSFALFRHSLNGLETGLYLLGQLLLLWWLVRRLDERPSVSFAARLGALLGVLVLVRIDAAILVIGAVIAFLTTWGRGTTWRRRVQLAAVCGTVALVVSGMWFVRSLVLFGAIMPSSGAAQSQLTTPATNVVRLASALAQPLFPALLPVGLRFGLAAFGWLAALIAMWWIVVRIAGERIGTRASAAWAPFWWAALGWSGFYVFAFGAPHFIERYLSPVAVALVPLLAVVLARALDSEHLARRAVRAGFAVAIVASAAEHVAILSDSRLATRNWNYIAQYRDLTAHLPAGTVVGAVQSGTLGYFHTPAVNLDGKLNRRALDARRAGALWRYVDDSEIEYVVDWPHLVDEALGPRKGEWERVGESAGFEAWRRLKRKRPALPPAVPALR